MDDSKTSAAGGSHSSRGHQEVMSMNISSKIIKLKALGILVWNCMNETCGIALAVYSWKRKNFLMKTISKKWILKYFKNIFDGEWEYLYPVDTQAKTASKLGCI